MNSNRSGGSAHGNGSKGGGGEELDHVDNGDERRKDWWGELFFLRGIGLPFLLALLLVGCCCALSMVACPGWSTITYWFYSLLCLLCSSLIFVDHT